jgi:hypothetical protein
MAGRTLSSRNGSSLSPADGMPIKTRYFGKEAEDGVPLPFAGVGEVDNSLPISYKK